ncbi:hypothetical protein [Saccharopolyspora sp. NPDC002376]
MNRTVAVRYTFGIVGETRREAHLATTPGTGIPAEWMTFCGVEIPANQAEVSEKPAGMPCVRCLAGVTRSITS